MNVHCVSAPQEEGFHCVVADPPWENKSASRGQKYPTLPSRRLLSIPVPQMLHKVQCSCNHAPMYNGGFCLLKQPVSSGKLKKLGVLKADELRCC